MLKNILKLEGTLELKKEEQTNINGGGTCSGNCFGQPVGSTCYFGGHCGCPGFCNTRNQCTPY